MLSLDDAVGFQTDGIERPVGVEAFEKELTFAVVLQRADRAGEHDLPVRLHGDGVHTLLDGIGK